MQKTVTVELTVEQCNILSRFIAKNIIDDWECAAMYDYTLDNLRELLNAQKIFADISGEDEHGKEN